MQSLSNQSNEKDRLLEYHQPWPPPPQRKTLPTNLHFPSRTNITGEHKYLCYIHLLGSIPVHLNIRHQVTIVPSLSSHPTWGTGSNTTEEGDGKEGEISNHCIPQNLSSLYLFIDIECLFSFFYQER